MRKKIIKVEPKKKEIQQFRTFKIVDGELVIDKTMWMDLDEIYENYAKPRGLIRMFVIGDNSLGKSYSIENMIIIKYLLKKIHCTWVRNTQIEIKGCVSAFSTILRRHKIEDNYIVDISGVYEKIQDGKKFRKGEYLISFVYLSSLDASIPQSVRSRCVVLDEFIPSNTKRIFTLKEPKLALKKMFSRLCRPLPLGEIVPFFAISNPNILDSDLLSDFKLDLNYGLLHSGKDQIEIVNKSLLIVLPKQFKIKENAGGISLFEDLGDAPENYTFPPAGQKRVYCNKPIEFSDKPTFNITFRLNTNEYSIYFSKTNQAYIEKLKEENGELPNYCLFEVDKNFRNIYVPRDEHQQQILGHLVACRMNRDGIYYDSLFTKTEMTALFTAINYIKRFNND